MHHRIVHIILMLLCAAATIPAASQSDTPSIKIQARATRQSIKLRWAPDSPAAWHLANEYGYTIERVALTINGQVQQNPQRRILNSTPFKPAREESWDPYMDTDDYVAIAAQAIFGEQFQLTNEYKSDMVSVINKARELESRFSFALFSADQSVTAAELSGLYHEDETIAPGTKYLYRIYTNIPPDVLAVDTGFVYIGLQDYTPLPKVRDVEAEFDDQMALLSWNGALVERTFNSFWVERSDDGGKTFHKTTEQPVINTFSGDNPKTRTIYKLDTLPANNIKYYYRVIGINAFGETGPPSDTVSGTGRPRFEHTASIVNHAITPEGHAMVEWTFPAAGESLIRSFDLLRMNDANKTIEEVKRDIDPKLRSVADESPRSTNYYVIRSNDRYGRENNSFPYLVQTEDSIPPSPPVGLTGRVDTLGRVFLDWEANTEEDLAGYHLYKSNFNSDEFIQVPGPILKTNSYVDTIKLNNLTEKIYYKLQAVDKRFNRSAFSAAINLKKPDVIPPVPPVFTAIRGDSSGIILSWQPSDSEDVVEHLLYRKAEHEDEWTLIKTFTLSDSLHKDISVEHRIHYAYTILAIDDDHLESIPAEPVSLRWTSPSPYPDVEKIYYAMDKTRRSITVSWQYDHSNVDRFLVYKAKNGEPLKLFKSLDPGTLEMKDSFSMNDSHVEYRIVASFKTGERTRVSKPLNIKM